MSYLEKSVGDRCHDMFRFLLFYSNSFSPTYEAERTTTAENPLCFPNGSASTGLARALPWCSADQFRCSATRWWQKWRHNLEMCGGEVSLIQLHMSHPDLIPPAVQQAFSFLKAPNPWLCLVVHPRLPQASVALCVRNLGIEGWTRIQDFSILYNQRKLGSNTSVLRTK